MLPEFVGPGAANHAPQDSEYENRIVGITDDGEEVGDQVDWHGEVCDQQPDRPADASGDFTLASLRMRRSVSGSNRAASRSDEPSGRMANTNTMNNSQTTTNVAATIARVHSIRSAQHAA